MSYFVPDGLGGKLTSAINNIAPKLGSTDAGSAWVMKALNPSAFVNIQGIPDMVDQDVINFKYDYVHTIVPPANISANDLWNCTINFHGDPVKLFDVILNRVSEPKDVSYSYTHLNKLLPLPKNITRPTIPAGTNLLNARIINDTFDAVMKEQTWQEMATQDRLTYGGITVVPQQSSEYDQGLCVISNVAQAPLKDSVLDTVTGGNIKRKLYTANDFADFDTAMQASNNRAHVGQAKDGAYTVIHMDEKFTQFKPTQSKTCIESNYFYGDLVSGTASKPLPGMFVTIENGTSQIDLRNKNMPQIFFTNLSPSASFLVRIRIGFESKPFPGCVVSPFMNISPMYDPMAMEMYSKLLLEVIKDGYTADWNAFGWLGDAIKRAAPALLRTASSVASNVLPGAVGQLVSAGGSALADSLEERPTRRRAAPRTAGKKLKFVPETLYDETQYED